MRNFNYDDNDEFKDGVDGFFRGEDDDERGDGSEEGPSGGGMIVDKDWLRHQQKILSARLSANLMSKAKAIAEQEWFWRFRNPEYKLKKIATVYFYLLDLMSISVGVPQKRPEESKEG